MRGSHAALPFVVVLFVLSARAEDVLGKRSFEDGIVAAQAQRWQEARSHFEASLTQADKPATRFNLVLVNEQLDQPLEVVRHALAFLALPEQDEHATARARTRELLAQATGRLATLTTDALPAALELYVDGAKPVVTEAHRIYLTPGPHRLETKQDGLLTSGSDVELSAGQVAAWPQPPEGVPSQDRVEQTAPAQPAPAGPESRSTFDARLPPSRRNERARTPIAWALGSMGAAIQLSALGVYLGALHRADEFGERDLFQPGVTEAMDDTLRLQNTVAPLALAGGALMAGAIATGARSRRVGSLGWSIAALATGSAMAGAGLALAVREPPSVPGSNLPEPTRQAGYLLASSALPLFAYGIGFLVTRRRARPSHASAPVPLGVRW
jgi:hypothetical protein